MRTLSEGFCCGNWRQDRDHKQWLVGQFRQYNLGAGHPLDDGRIEIKTASHQAGAERRQEDTTAKKSGKAIEVITAGMFTSMWFEVDGEIQRFDLDSHTAHGNNFLV
ncbi:MAG: hypothetical protein COT71_01830 [Candidatus Andersenbacteria bacterium CG10_big_fil_rev_8_21_14_0_10_54_11]|uniref:Uncharacterized protein n=1 Tax=Candidatus Andersenbacteria bacterium CG10_big_fil_rev_8_21_14_0_10_54_11 TaxID=1974485 RepID=A0A2M6WZS9_9BACT|nr:MAG: hypothetical protein COT71_01830 [Candidatus Andersenbacteria bacterium CG10_big_fil_rev_8_21_14_0_10_54_11]